MTNCSTRPQNGSRRGRTGPRRGRRHPDAAVDRPVLHRGVIFGYTLFFADSGERAVVQALLMGSGRR